MGIFVKDAIPLVNSLHQMPSGKEETQFLQSRTAVQNPHGPMCWGTPPFFILLLFLTISSALFLMESSVPGDAISMPSISLGGGD